MVALDIDRPALEFVRAHRRLLTRAGLLVGSVPNAYRYPNRLDVLRGLPIDRDPWFFSVASLRAILVREFEAVGIVPVRGKWSRRFPSLFAHKLAWRCVTPDTRAGG